MWLSLVLTAAAMTATEAVDMSLVAAMARHLHVSQCILTKVSPYKDAISVKTLSRQFIFTTIVSSDDLLAIVVGKNRFPVRALVGLDNDTQIIAKTKNLRFSSQLYWIMETSNEPSLLQNAYIPMDCSFWLASPISSSTKRTLTAVYQIKPNDPITIQPYGELSTLMDVSAMNTDIVVARRNFFGAFLTLRKNLIDPCIFDLECIQYNIWKDFSTTLNFTARFLMENELNGTKPDGVAGVSAFHSIIRENMVAPTFKGKVNIYIRDIGNTADIWQSYFRPFSLDLWITLAAWSFTSSFILVFIHYLVGQRGWNLLSVALKPIDALSNQGQSVGSNKFVSQLSVFMPYVLSVVTFPAYAAAIISFLAVHVPVYPFTDVEGFRKDGTYRMGSLNGSFSILYIQASNSKEMREIAQKLTVPQQEMSSTFSEGMERMCRDSKFAFLAYNSLVDEMSKRFCPIRRIPTPLTPVFAGLPIAEDSPYKPIFKMILINYYSSGLVNRIEKNLSATYDLQQTFSPIEVYQLAIPLLSLAVGMVAAFAFFTWERKNKLINRKRKKRKHVGPFYDRILA